MVNNPQELIAILIAQHHGLRNDLNLVVDELNSETALNGSVVVSNLAKFKIDLLEHLKLEDVEFYPDYLSKKEINGEDTASTKEFIRMMQDIVKAVMAFLDKYSDSEVIENSRSVFDNELHNIIDILNARIETEEEGVYNMYLVS